MAQTAQTLTEEQIPAGGIADFVMSDEEIAALEAEEAREEFGENGIANFPDVAKRMASYGRYGDDQVVHAETGELMVPKALIEQNPELKESIFNHLREMGVEDPERYVVGSSANSINPDTGMPEFFLKKLFGGVKKAVSGIAKGVGKALKGVGKALKKIAPVVLPIALAMTPLGPIYGAALGSGIGTLVQGGNIKDALKSALVSGAVGGVTAGFTGSAGSFGANVKDAFSNFGGRLAQTGTGLREAVSGQGFGTLTGGYQVPGSQVADEIAAGRAGLGEAEAQALQQQNLAGTSGTPVTAEAAVEAAAPGGDMFYAQQPGGPVGQELADTLTTQVTPAGTERGFLDRAGDLYSEYLSPSRGMQNIPTLEAEMARIQAANPNMAAANIQKAAEASIASQTPGMISRYAPLAAAGTGLAAAGGFFEAAPTEEPNLVDRRTGMDLIEEDPSRYLVGDRTVVGAQGPYEVPSRFRFMGPQMYAEAGGEVYPRRNGGIMPDEGIPDQDSVRALLMPGEFVMTTDAVRGLGNGNLNQGINNMYSVMRNLEAKGRAA